MAMMKNIKFLKPVEIDGDLRVTGDGHAYVNGEKVATLKDISTVYKYCGSVSTYAALPASSAVSVGDVYNVIADNGMNYAWDGEKWDSLGLSVDLSSYMLKQDAVGTKTSSGGEKFNYHGNTASALDSHAEGRETVASKDYAHAEGKTTTASGRASHSEGDNTTASGAHSHAEGTQTLANTHSSHAEGMSTSAGGTTKPTENTDRTEGYYAHAEGNATWAKGNSAHAEGIGTEAQGIASHAEGVRTFAGEGAHAEGNGTNASGTYSHAEGQGSTASGVLSHAEGYLSDAEGKHSHAEGAYTQATNNVTHAEGNLSVASGEESHAEGYSSQAAGKRSHSQGSETKAYGYAAHSEGIRTRAGTSTETTAPTPHTEKAEGYFSHAEGNGTWAKGNSSHAGGIGTIAAGMAQTAIGKYNTDNNTSDLFVVGNGVSASDRKDAFAVGSDGTTKINGAVAINGDKGADGTFLTTDGTKTYWSGYKAGEGITFNTATYQRAYISSINIANYYENGTGYDYTTYYRIELSKTQNKPSIYNTGGMLSMYPEFKSSGDSAYVWVNFGGVTEKLFVHKAELGDALILTGWPFSTPASSPVDSNDWCIFTENLTEVVDESYISPMTDSYNKVIDLTIPAKNITESDITAWNAKPTKEYVDNAVASIVEAPETAQVGQTIIVKEVDENGKPTKWESADYQPRTHWSEEAVILPETTVEIDPDAGMGVIPAEFVLVGGQKYTVMYNDVEYADCKCMVMEESFILGNAGVLDENAPATEHPFCIAYGVLDTDENNDFIYGWACAALDGSTSVTVSITEKVYHTIPKEYIPSEKYIYKIPMDSFEYVYSSNNVESKYRCYMPEMPLTLLEAMYRKVPIYLEVTDGVKSYIAQAQYGGLMDLAWDTVDKTLEAIPVDENFAGYDIRITAIISCSTLFTHSLFYVVFRPNN